MWERNKNEYFETEQDIDMNDHEPLQLRSNRGETSDLALPENIQNTRKGFCRKSTGGGCGV